MAEMNPEKEVLDLLQAVKWYDGSFLPSRIINRRNPTLTEELQQEIKEYFGENVNVVKRFILYAGPLPEDKEARLQIYAALKPLAKYFFGTVGLINFYEMAVYENINTAYKSGKLSPELAEAINDKYRWPEDMLQTFFNDANEGPLDYLLKQGRVNFEPFRGPKDTETNWFSHYPITFYPLPFYCGPLDNTGKAYQQIKAGNISNLAANTLRLLKGMKAPDGETLLNPVTPEEMEAYAAAVELQYRRRKKERTPGNIEKYYGNSSAGFYVNPESCRVYDLRPYTKELEKLLAVKNWDFLKLYVATIRAATAEFKGEAAGKKKQKPPGSIFDKAFIKMFNATPTNDITALNTSKSGRPGEENGYFEQNMFTKEWEYKKGGTELNLPVKTLEGDTLPPAFTTSTLKTMHFLSLLFSAQNSQKGDNITPVIETSVREYMAATGRPITTNTIKETSKTLKKDLELLNEVKIKYNDKKYSLSLVRPFPGVHLNRGKIRVTLDNDFAWYLAKTTGFLMNYPAALLKLKENNSNLYPLGYKLALNRSNDANIRRGKANILSIPVCLEFCPGIPSIEKVRKEGKGGSPAKRIIEPFEKALDSLQQQGVLERWEYCLPKGQPLKQAAITDYNYFASLYILYEIKDFPIKNELPRIQAAAERRQKKQERIDRLTEKEIAKKRAKAE